MPLRVRLLLVFPLLVNLAGIDVRPAGCQSDTAPNHLVRYRLEVTLDPMRRTVAVEARVTMPASTSSEREFVLNDRLTIERSVPAVRKMDAAAAPPDTGIDDGPGETVSLARYRVALPREGGTVTLTYSGPFDFGLSAAEEEYTRGFRSTPGLVSPDGVYLAGDGAWYPKLGDGLVEFEMSVHQPDGWRVVSEGNGTSRDAAGVAHWSSHGPVDEIHVVGGPLQLTRQAAGVVETEVYLREPDSALAAKYLSATAQYLEMYRGLIGPYPYGKFALVENFWETGYGMPSFTLLGPQVIRFPFIITSSYPHEILHNWWGNSVFVDYATGNWSEGLTAYLADHLIQEQRGAGDAYRRATLQKYRDYVRDGRDFALTDFRARHSAATEAVGYGRTLMGFHMLRRRIGDEAFRTWARRFYRDYRGRRASFDDVRRTLEAASTQDLSRFFDDWIARPGAATLAVSVEGVTKGDRGYVTTGSLRQVQPGRPFMLAVPMAVQTTGGVVLDTIALDGPESRFRLTSADRPLSVAVDPAFDVFRRLDPRETPPSIGQIFGDVRVLAVVPGSAAPAEAAAWRALVEGWRSPSHDPEIRTDTEITSLPPDRPVWILGRTNRLAPALVDGDAVKRDGSRLVIDGSAMDVAGHTAVIVRRHPGNPEKAIGWIVADPPAALPGLGRKLPHYGKYSYLAFEGTEPVNTLKGEWAQSDSPLRVDLRPPAERSTALPALALPARAPLAGLPPVFSESALAGHVTALAAPELEGRGMGTKGLDRAAEHVAAQFKAAGLAPAGDAGTYFQRFETTETPDGTSRSVANIVGTIPGTDQSWQGQAVLVTAHYDHLGLGWPGPRRGDEGKVHAGADDNASGVAVLLELARVFASTERPRRTILFVAFTGEEVNRLGSRYYVTHPITPLDRVIGVINIDSVGRLFTGPLSVIATGTATEWPHIFRGASYVTGVESRNVPEALPSSDQASFIERGVPAVQIVAPTHADYHRPTDTPDRIDVAGLVKVATLVKEAVEYLAGRETALTVTITPADSTSAAAQAPSATAPATTRRASLGTIPDFSFAGSGVKISGVTPGSPAERAGLRAGDVLVSLGGKEIASLQAYSDILKTLEPGRDTELVVVRDAKRVTFVVRPRDR